MTNKLWVGITTGRLEVTVLAGKPSFMEDNGVLSYKKCKTYSNLCIAQGSFHTCSNLGITPK
jgi:hypothetical protein